ncbi:MAG: flippase-like domain-containing protein [Saprospiraceae bacterium]|nr:flippase-like domain-containing protein [Saprospiraceae bacterium]
MFSSNTRSVAMGKRSVQKRLLNFSFKALAMALPAAVLYFELSKRDNLGEIAATFWLQLGDANAWWLIGAVGLLPFNWLAEVQKWQPLVARTEPMTRWKALQAVLAGMSFALFTPNRVGEYGARILFVRPENQWKALLANMVGSMSQYLVLLSSGILGGLWFAGQVFAWDTSWQAGLLVLSALPLAALFYLFFNIRLLLPLARRIPFLNRLPSYLRDVYFLEKIERTTLTNILVWSVLRYAIYSTQYVLLLHFFGVNVGFLAGYAGVATIYLLQTVVPLPALAGLLVRGSLAVFAWSHFGANEISSLSATFVLWIINLILPALLGTFSLVSVNITKSLGYDD